ncbi:MAG: tetratricopeptide repeat protein [Fibrobacteres bacterium]|nr:tetratricopeptide repeat protein [Fibrobacterota bacterium]
MSNFPFNRKPSHLSTLLGYGATCFASLALVLALAGAVRAEAPKSAEEWFKRANEMYQEGAVDEAIGSLQEALKLKKDFPEALSLLGAAYVESGEFAKAVEPYKAASELKPNDYSILLGYSNALEGAGRQEEELPVVKKLFNLNKNDMVTGIKYLTLMEAAGREKHVADYIAVLEDLRKLPNSDPTYTAKLARAYNKTGDYAKAVGAYTELVKASPESGEYWSGLANAQAKIDPVSAKVSYQKAILYTDKADERARLQKAMAALGNAPAPAKTAAPAAAAPAAPVAVAPSAPAAPVIAGPSAADKAREAAEAKAKADADRKAAEVAAAAEAKAKADADKATKAEAAALAAAEAKAKADAAKQSKEAAAFQAAAEKKAAAEAKAQAEASAKAQAEADRKSKQDAEAQAAAEKKAAAEVTAQTAAANKAQAELDKKALAEAKAKAHADSVAQAQADKKAKLDAVAQAAAEKKALAEAEAKAKADAKAAALAQAEADKKARDEAARLAREDASRKAKEHADSLATAAAAKKAADLAAAADAKTRAEIERKAKEEAQKLAKEEAARKAKERTDSLARVAVEKKAAADAEAKAKAEAKAAALAQAAAEKQAKEEAIKLAKEDAARKAKARADSLAQVQAERKAVAEAEAKAKVEAQRLAREEASRKAKEHADSVATAVAAKKAADLAAAADAKARAEVERKAKEEALKLAKEEAARKAKERTDSLAQVAAAKKAAAEAEAKAKAEAQKLAKEETDRRAKARADSLAQAAIEKKAAAEAEAKAKAEAQRLAKEDAARRLKARNDSLAQVAAEKKAAAEAEAKAKAEAKAAALAQAAAEKAAEAKAKAEAQKLAKEEADRRAKARADSLSQVAAEKKAAAEAEAKAKAEAQKLAKEEADRRAKARADSLAQVAIEKKAAAEAEAKAKAEAQRLAKEEADRRAKAKADSLAQVAIEKKAAAEAAAKAKAEAQRLAKEDADRRAKARADSLAQVAIEKKAAAEAEAKAKAEAKAAALAQAAAEKKAKEEAARLAKEEADRRAKARADSLAQVALEKKAAAEAEAKAKAEAQRLAKEEADRRAKARADSLAQVAAEKKAAAEAEAKAKAEAARVAKIEADRRAKAHADSLAQVAAEKKAAAEAARLAKLEAERLAKIEAERRAKAKADSIAVVVAERKAAAEAKAKADAEAARLAKEEADRRAKAKADSLSRVAAEKKAAAEEAARLAKLEAERKAKARADSLEQVAIERKAAAEAKAKADAEAARLAREEAIRVAKARADSLSRVEAERKAKAEAERLAREEAARLAREEAARVAKAKADSLAKVEAERRAAAEAEREFQGQVSSLIAQQPGKLDTATVLAKIQDRKATAKIPDPRLYQAEAVINFRQWNFRPAVENLRKVKVLSSSENRMMALSLFELQDYAGALKYFQKVPDIASNRAEWGKYIKTLLETKQRPVAAAQYEGYLAKYPDADDALNFLVDYYRQPLQKEKLIPKLEMQLAKNPKDAALLSELIALYDKASPRSIEYRERYLQENPDDAKQAMALAQAYEAKNNLPAALKIYQKLAKDAPTDKALNLKTAELLYAAGQKEESVRYFEQAHDAEPKDKKVTLRLASVYEELKKTDKAAQTYAAALEADPKDKAVQSKLFQLYTAKGDKEQIRALLMKMDDSDPTAHQAQYQLAKSFLAEGDKDKAYVYLSKALRNQPANPEYLGMLPSVVQSDEQVDAHFAALQTAALQPNAKPELQAMMARAYAKRKNNVMAAKLYAEAYAKNPKLLEGQREAVVSVYDVKNMELAGALAANYLATDDKDRAIHEIQVNAYMATNKSPEKMRDAIKGLAALDPDGATKWSMRLAQLDLAAKDTSAAIGHAKEFLDKNPKNVEGWRFLAPLVARRSGQEDTYINVLEKLVVLEPANRGRYDLELGNLYLSKGNYEDAEKSLLSASKANPASASLWFKLGETQTKLRKEKEAAEKYQRAYLLEKTNLTYVRAYATSVDTKDEIKANLPLFQTLAQNGPSVDERKKLAQAYFLNGDFANAAKEFDWLLKGDPGLATSEPMVSEAYMRTGQTAKARGLFEQRLKDDPNNLPLLETVANIYKAEGNQAGYVATVEKIVAVDPKFKGYQLVLAVEKEKAKDYKGALEQYGQWVSRNAADINAVKSMHRLAESQKDTAALMESLVRLNREKNVDNAYKFQLAELDYKRSGNVGGVERLVKVHPEWKRGKEILVKEYLRTNAMAKLIPLQGFLLAESKTNKDLLEPLADLYVMQKKTLLANQAYHDLLVANPKERDVYTKVYKYSAANNSPYMQDILRIGYENYPDDIEAKRAYAATLGKTPKALGIYQEILAKETDVKVVAKALDIALALNQTQAAAALLDKWINIESKDPKVWEQALAVHTQMANKPRMIEDLEQLVRFYPARKEFPLQLARLYEEAKQPDKAADMYQKALALDPKNKGVQSKLVSLLISQKREGELRELLLTIDKNDPTSNEAQFMLAKMYLADNDRDRAYVFVTKALRNQPANPEYLALLPQTVVSDEQVMANFPALEKFALQPGAKPELQALVARGYAKKKNWPLSAKLFSEAYAKNPRLLDGNRDAVIALNEAKNYELAGKLAETYLLKDDKDRQIREIEVNAFTATGKPPEKMREAIKGLIAVDPEGRRFNMRLAQLDLAVRDTSMAIVHAREWLDKNPKDANGWRFVLPLVAKRPGSEDVYIQVLERLVQLEPATRARYDLELGNLYFDKGNYEEAEKSLSSAVKSSPASAKLWYRLGETLVKLRKDKESFDKFARAYQLEPTNLTYARAYSRSVDTKDEIKANLPLFKILAANGPSVEERKKLGQAYFLNGDYANAAKEFDWQLQGDPTLGSTDPMYADAYMKTGQTAKARGLYEQRLVQDPNNLVVLETVAGIYKVEGNQKAYVSTVEKIVNVDPKYKGYQLILAVEKEKAKDFKGALQEYSEWVTRNVNDEVALKSMHRLADQQKDTAALMDALVRLTRQKGADPAYAFQLAEVDYVRSGNIAGIERLVKTHPTYNRGKVILVKSYYKKGALAKMVPFLPFMSAQAKVDKTLSEPLADLYASMKKPAPANEAYFDAVRADKKDRDLFDKAYKYAKEHDSPYRAALLKQGYEGFPDDVGLKYDYALTLGKTQKALDLYGEILRTDHNNLPAVRNAAEVAVALVKTADAEDHLQHWVALEPEQVRPWQLLVDLYTQNKNDTKLAEALEHYSALSPKNGDLAFRAAMVNKKIGRKDKALDLLTKAVALNGTNPLYQKEFGLMLFSAGQTAKAKAPLLIADRSFKNDEAINSALYNIYLTEKNKGLARERLRFLFALRPADKTYAYSLARLESELKNPTEAVKILERPAFKEDLNAEMSFLLLDGYFKLGQKDRAANLGPVLIRKFPEEAKQSLPLAILFYETKNKSKAKEILETYVRNSPSEEAFYYLGKCYFDEKNWQGAINNLDRADLNRPDVLSMLGQSYIANKEPERAIKAYEDYYTKTKDIKVLAELYSLYKKTNDPEGTRAILERLIAAEPGNYDYRVELAELYRGKGDIKKAEAQYEMILKKIPTHPASNMNYGMILANRKEYPRAIRMLETGLAKYPDSATAWRYLADAYRAEKRYASSLQAYKKAFKLQPQSLPIAVAKMQMSKELSAADELPTAYADVIRLDSSNVEAASALAEIRFNERKYRDAAALYGRITSGPGGAKVDKASWANYGYSLLEIKNIDGAKRALQRAVDLGDRSPRVMTSLARIYKEEGNSDKAEAILSEMVKKDPRNHLAYYWLGQIATERNQPGVAEDYFKKAQLLQPTNGDYAEALAKMQYNKDEFANAARLLEPVKANLSSSGRLIYGDCLMRQGKNEAALAEFNTIFAKDPSAPVLAKLAELQINKGNNREAIRTIEGSEFKDDTTVQFSLAKARIATRETEKAREVLERLIRMNKYSAPYYHYRGLSYYYDHNYDKAKKDFDMALKYNPDYMDAVYHIGLCLLKDGSPADAKNYFKELSQHANTSWQAKGFLGLAMSFESEKKYEAAENFLQKSINAEETPEGLSLLAKVLLRMRKPGEAEKHARKALELQPGNATAVVAMGDVLLAQNRKPEALSLAKKALEGNPNSCELLIGSAKINFASGNYETSKSNSTYAISICPEEASPYYYAGVVADKKYLKKEAKDYFKAFRKHGGDEDMLPADYR